MAAQFAESIEVGLKLECNVHSSDSDVQTRNCHLSETVILNIVE
jgi:hypothetical protein